MINEVYFISYEYGSWVAKRHNVNSGATDVLGFSPSFEETMKLLSSYAGIVHMIAMTDAMLQNVVFGKEDPNGR